MMKNDILIREMTLDDYDGVMGLMRVTPGVSVREADSREATEAYLKRNPGLSFVAERGGAIVGCVMCGHDGRRGYLQHLVVRETERRMGVGSCLVGRCIDGLEGLGIKKTHIHVFRSNDLANGYWGGKGWERRDDIYVYSFNRSANPNV